MKTKKVDYCKNCCSYIKGAIFDRGFNLTTNIQVWICRNCLNETPVKTKYPNKIPNCKHIIISRENEGN